MEYSLLSDNEVSFLVFTRIVGTSMFSGDLLLQDAVACLTQCCGFKQTPVNSKENDNALSSSPGGSLVVYRTLYTHLVVNWQAKLHTPRKRTTSIPCTEFIQHEMSTFI